jgi:putative pyruvate formate lyase activating enzyme
MVLIAGCNLGCIYCETYEFSLQRRGVVPVSSAQLASLLLDLQKRGARNANFVTPTHVLPAVLDGLAAAAEHGFALPVVWNCGGYESLAALRLLEGVVDLYLPDAKYGDDRAAFDLSGCRDYTGALRESLREMHRQGEVLVRHLVLPGIDSAAVMELIAAISPALPVNVLSQYRPVHRASRFLVVSSAASDTQVSAAIEAAWSVGLRTVYLDGKAARPARPCSFRAAR